MSDDPIQADARPWTPSRRGRVAVGLFAGFGATGIAAGLGLAWTSLEVHLPFFDPSGLIVMAPVIIAPGFAGAVLRERDAVVAITAGAVAAPIAATFAVDGSCPSNVWAFFGLAAAAASVLVLAGIAALVGSSIGRRDTVPYQPRRHVIVLVVFGAIGSLAWIIAIPRLYGCP